MALTQRLARVAPAEDLLDTDWATWGLIRHCRGPGADPGTATLLDRAISGDSDGDLGFLDHDEVYDGFTDPPRQLTPAAVADIATGLEAIDADALLARLPDSPEEASVACGFGPAFHGDLAAHLAEHLTALREFYREAARRRQCVVVWVD